VVRDAALDKKAEDLIEIDITGKTIIADTFVIATGRSKIQTRSIADAILENVKAAGFHIARTEGYSDGTWILLDLGDVVVHIFTPEQRLFYNLERLWANAADRQVQLS
jgi:ribosome-associated protein